MIGKEDISKLYQNEDSRVISFLENLVISMGGKVPSYYKTVLDMLQVQLFLYYNAQDIVKKSGILVGDNNVKTKNQAITILNQSYSHIMEIMRECGTTKLAKARLNKLDKIGEDDTNALLEALTA